jgi:hypothetical protein
VPGFVSRNVNLSTAGCSGRKERRKRKMGNNEKKFKIGLEYATQRMSEIISQSIDAHREGEDEESFWEEQSQTESYFQAGFTVKAIPATKGCLGCMFDRPDGRCVCDNEIIGLPGCQKTKMILIIESMEAVEYEED